MSLLGMFLQIFGYIIVPLRNIRRAVARSVDVGNEHAHLQVGMNDRGSDARVSHGVGHPLPPVLGGIGNSLDVGVLELGARYGCGTPSAK